MSSFYASTFHPITDKIENAFWIDDHFGRHKYGVQFSSDGKVYDPWSSYEYTLERVGPKAEALIKKLQQQLMTQRVEAADSIDELVAALERSIWYLEDEGYTDEFTVMLDLKAVLTKHKKGTDK